MSIKDETKAKKTEYACGICGKSYDNIADRITCETKCLDERTKAEEAMRRQKLELEKEARKKEIENMYSDLHDAISEYVKDYGAINLRNCSKRESNFPTLGSLFDFWSF